MVCIVSAELRHTCEGVEGGVGWKGRVRCCVMGRNDGVVDARVTVTLGPTRGAGKGAVPSKGPTLLYHSIDRRSPHTHSRTTSPTKHTILFPPPTSFASYTSSSSPLNTPTSSGRSCAFDVNTEGRRVRPAGQHAAGSLCVPRAQYIYIYDNMCVCVYIYI